MDTARNLLHGVLAWRAGLVDADQFTAGCRAWAEHQERPLADVFTERGWLTGVLPGAAWLEEEPDRTKRGLLGSTAALAVVLVLVAVVVLAGLGGSTLLLMKQRQHETIARMEAMRAMEAAAEQRARAEANY